MEIHFCDICNESVPEQHLTDGRAFRRKGRVVCASCDAAMSGPPRPALAGAGEGGAVAAAPAGVARRRSALAPALVLACALGTAGVLLALGVLFTTRERLETVEDRVRGGVVALRSELESTTDSMERDVESARRYALEEVGLLERRLEELERTRVQELEALRRGAADESRRVAELANALQALEARVATPEPPRDEALREEVGRVRAELAGVAERLWQLEELLGPVGAEADDAAPSGPPPWAGLLPELESDDPGTRWSAVQALGETGESEVVQHIVPRLDDEDLFVRMAAARVLGELEAWTAIEALIDTLEDAETPVREAAMLTLRRLTGEDFHFDPTASEPERARRIDDWRDWWRRQSETIGGGAGRPRKTR